MSDCERSRFNGLLLRASNQAVETALALLLLITGLKAGVNDTPRSFPSFIRPASLITFWFRGESRTTIWRIATGQTPAAMRRYGAQCLFVEQ